MQGLVDGMRHQRPEESSIAAHLLEIKDPETGDHHELSLQQHPPDCASCMQQMCTSCHHSTVRGVPIFVIGLAE